MMKKTQILAYVLLGVSSGSYAETESYSFSRATIHPFSPGGYGAAYDVITPQASHQTFKIPKHKAVEKQFVRLRGDVAQLRSDIAELREMITDAQAAMIATANGMDQRVLDSVLGPFDERVRSLEDAIIAAGEEGAAR